MCLAEEARCWRGRWTGNWRTTVAESEMRGARLEKEKEKAEVVVEVMEDYGGGDDDDDGKDS